MFNDVEKITMGFELTTNLGNYENIKIHGSVEVAVVDGNLKAAREQAMGSLNRQIVEMESVEFLNNVSGVQQTFRKELSASTGKK